MTNPDLLPEEERELFLRDARLGLGKPLAGLPPQKPEVPSSGLSGDGKPVPKNDPKSDPTSSENS